MGENPSRSIALPNFVRQRQVEHEISTDAIDRNDFTGYQQTIIHSWLRTITALTFVLVPMFFVLDIFVTPPELLIRFAIYRTISTALALIQHFIVRYTKPSKFSFLHGYFVSFQAGGFIALMTVFLGGFSSGYYAGLIMVIIGANLLMPWHAAHTAANATIIVAMYTGLNIFNGGIGAGIAAANNLFFLIGVSVISVAINHVRYRLIQSEFSLLVQLKQARDALWSEMELAKQVQVALLPRRLDMSGYDVAVSYEPALEVGGDYYDVIETGNGVRFVTIGDVAGHGLDSGLIMMMAQTAVMSVIKGDDHSMPTDVLATVNTVLRENVGRLGSNHYMTMSVLRLENDRVIVAGHHQDILVYRQRHQKTETISVSGSWLGIADNIRDFTTDHEIPIAPGDGILLFSDGVTEAMSPNGQMYGQERLTSLFSRVSDRAPSDAVEAIRLDVDRFQLEMSDDVTIIFLKRNT